jgi:4-amino-4-deoxy-L-arabinose transferase-like glycosyltransferase
LARLFAIAATPFDYRKENLGLRGFNDEPSHLNFVRHLAEHAELPVQTRSVLDADAFLHNDFEYYQAPLYYILAAPAFAAVEAAFPGKGPFAARLLSGFFGVLIAAVAFSIGARFGPRAACLCGWIAALFPTSIYFTSLAGNDSLAWLMGALLLHRVLASPPRGRGHRDILPLGLLLGLGLLAKSSLLTWLPLLFVKPVLAALRDRRPAYLVPACAAAALALAVAFPYYARNLELYGSPLGMAAGHGVENGLFFEPAWPRWHDFLAWSLVTFWFSPHPGLIFGSGILQGLLVGMSILTAGIFLLGWGRELLAEKAGNGDRTVLIAAVLLAAAGYLHYNLSWLQADARLMFHAFPALVALFALCLSPREAAGLREIGSGQGNPRSEPAAPATP